MKNRFKDQVSSELTHSRGVEEEKTLSRVNNSQMQDREAESEIVNMNSDLLPAYRSEKPAEE